MTILNLKSLNIDTTILQMTIYGNSIKKTLRTLQKLSLRPINLQLSVTYEPSSMIKVYGLKKINGLLLYGLYIIYYIKRTQQNRP